MLTLARGRSEVTMVKGNFRIEDQPLDIIRPVEFTLRHNVAKLLHHGTEVAQLQVEGSQLVIRASDPAMDRIWLDLHAEPGEAVWGGGEQMSYLALNGRAFPMWTSEPGVGRDKSTELTRQMDEIGMAGGDYWNTNYPGVKRALVMMLSGKQTGGGWSGIARLGGLCQSSGASFNQTFVSGLTAGSSD